MPAGGDHRYLFFTARPGLLEAAGPGGAHLHGHVHGGRRPEPHDRRGLVRRLGRGLRRRDGLGLRRVAPVRGGPDRPGLAPGLGASSSSDAAGYRPGETRDAGGAHDRRRRAAGPVRRWSSGRSTRSSTRSAGRARSTRAGDLYWWTAGENGIASSAASHPVPVYEPALRRDLRSRDRLSRGGELAGRLPRHPPVPARDDRCRRPGDRHLRPLRRPHLVADLR